MPKLRLTELVFLALGALLGCDAHVAISPDGGDGSGAAGSMGTQADGAVDASASELGDPKGCLRPAPANEVPTFSCALPQPCAKVFVDNAGYLGPGEPTPDDSLTLDLTVARCFLQHLRDDAPSHLTLYAQERQGFGSRQDDVWVQGDGSAILLEVGGIDIAFWNYLPRRFQRQDDAFFDACLVETDLKKVYACLRHWRIETACYPIDSLPCTPP